MHQGADDSEGGAHKHVKIPLEDWRGPQAYVARPGLLVEPIVFLSCAQSDHSVGREVARWLADCGFGVLLNGSVVPPDRPGASVSGAGPDMLDVDAANAFVVLLSPAFLASHDCLTLLDLADRRQQRIRPARFIHVLQVADTADLDTSRFQGYRPIDLSDASGRRREDALNALGRRIASSRHAWQAFIDRRDELDKVVNGLTSPNGPHFWLVMGPPGLGKTTFLRRLAVRVGNQAGRNWISTLVDLRDDAADCADDPMALVGRLFGRERPEDSMDGLVAVARQIIRAGRPYLCLLDGADLLSPATAAALRMHLSRIYHMIWESGNPDVGLAFVVGSRRDDGWRGVTPSPRFSLLPLPEFDAPIVQEALSGLAARMNRQQSTAELRVGAALVHGVAEGVPPLVVRGLQWIQAQEWLEITRLRRADVFDHIAQPYIRDELLTRESLLPGDVSEPKTSQVRLRTIERAIAGLVPYRFFTVSHLRRHRSGDRAFVDALERAHWSFDDLWRAISGCALLARPLDEPWQEIYPAIRRLLFRHFYAEAERAEAHRAACEFTDIWSASQSGREQVIGLVDCIWHEAALLRLTDVAKMADVLTKSVRERVSAISPSGAYTVIELRAYAAERMRHDDELRGELAGFDGLFESLIGCVEGAAADGALA